MKSLFAAIAGLACIASVPASAAALCNCCGGGTVQSCAVACSAVKPEAGQCVATVDYEAEAEIGEGVNPLYEVPLRNVWLGSPGDSDLEAFRRLLENSRKGAEADRRRALRDYRRNTIDAATAESFAKRYDDAIVNYFLGIQAYRLARDSTN